MTDFTLERFDPETLAKIIQAIIDRVKDPQGIAVAVGVCDREGPPLLALILDGRASPGFIERFGDDLRDHLLSSLQTKPVDGSDPIT